MLKTPDNEKLIVMSNHIQVIYQIVFSTKYRRKCMLKQTRPQVFAYMGGILKNRKCKPFIINGIEDHVHILTHIHPTVALSTLVKEIKMGSHSFIEKNRLFPDFKNWQNGYGAFTYSSNALPNLMRYIENQELHHRGVQFEEEYVSLLEEQHVEYDAQYLFD